ncbi:MAG: ABC transporter ATP-binding protein [Chitinophagaceae bacterium]|nr:ABC transporter ATP-binding protein [Chitinophagaceae bacterium]MCW5926316.1 ABC transporter ATP-binding protein [Chitinophagaceae bacterium]
MILIETQNLDFAFEKGDAVLKSINLNVEQGAIYGFLGPNGSGKTTTIRLILGLLPNAKNNIRLFGQNLSDNRINILSKIGSLIEQPSLYEHLSGYENLEIIRRIRNVSKNRIDKVLQLVDLKSASQKKVVNYSLGMKQRLGLAIALISEPELLVLDEPVNGLDPNGIIEIRELLLNLNRENGITIFLSSHLLSEIEKIVTHLGILSKGQLVFQGRYDELTALQNKSAMIYIETSDNRKSADLIEKKYKIIDAGNSHIQLSYQNREQVAAICKLLVEMNIDIYKVQLENNDLENIFLDITSN